MVAKTKRTYEEPWTVLRDTGKVTMQVVGSTNEAVIAKHAKTYRKAIQKEKFRDENFRKKYPSAYISSEIEGNNVRFQLHYNEYTTLATGDFSCSNSNQDGGMS